jgi:uncharacterized lipoprotein YddW (UPF0748 family)
MKQLFYTVIILASLLNPLVVHSQSPKREMRATWLATVWRLDWPSTTVPAATGSNETARQTAVNTQKNGLIAILDKLQSENINAVFFQIRSMSDAFYPSSYEPWSHFISATRGSDPGYDPLAFAVDEAHKRGIELHAWINPYRYSSSEGTHGNLPDDYAQAHSDWLLDYGSSVKILNPGKPEVVQRIADIVAEVVANYDVDGIVFDDYFYVSGTTDAMDQAQYNAYNPQNLARGDWRRANVNRMIKTVYDRIQSIKPGVTFGVSPAGVAASSKAVADKYGVPPSPGSDWQYSDIFSDPLAWLSEGSVDYISPQIYWTIGSGNDYAQLSDWWSKVSNRFGKHFYASHSLTDMSSSMQAPSPSKSYSLQNEEIPETALSTIERSAQQDSGNSLRAFGFSEIGNQVECNRNYDLNGAPGSVFYATTKSIVTGFVNYMNTNQFQYKALPPAISWKPAETQGMVENLSLSGQNLSWTYSGANVRYAIYAAPKARGNDPQVFASALYLQGTAYAKQYALAAGVSAATHRIAVSVVDRYGNEFAPRVLGENTTSPAAAVLLYPLDNATVVMPALFTWEAVSGAGSYVWQIAGDNAFNDLIASRETVDPQFNAVLVGNLDGNARYYWRVKTIHPNAGDAWSVARSFTGELFQILTPANGSVNVPLTPSFTWPEIEAGANYTLEIAATNTFSSLVYSVTVQETAHTVPANVLTTGTTYYARVKANTGAVQVTSPVSSFTLVEVEIPVPQIVSPEENANLYGTSIEVCWQEQVSQGFKIELAPDADFPLIPTKVKVSGANVYCITFSNLTPGTYYIRVSAKNKGGYTAPSETIAVTLNKETALNSTTVEAMKVRLFEDHLIIDTDRPSPAQTSIYSLSGQLLSISEQALQYGENTLSLDWNDKEKGIYLIRIKTDTKVMTLKLKR